MTAEQYQCYKLEFCEAAERWVSLALFQGVSNAPKLRADVTSGKISSAVLLDPTHIGPFLAGGFHVLAAVNQAVMREEGKQMKTKSLLSEVIFCLSASTNISESFRRFGLKDTSQSVLAAVLHSSRSSNEVTTVLDQISGEMVPLDALSSLHSSEEIKKVFKIPPEESEISSLENSVVTRIVTKDVT